MHDVDTTDRAILVSLGSGDEDRDRAALDELRELASTAGADVLDEFIQNRQRPDNAFYLGQGKAEELFAEVKDLDANLVIINGDLSPTQLRNLEAIVKTRVVDRTQLILDIFAQRAHTREGQLQVELAQLTYILPRITSVYTQFERQQGGIGMRGPGETKLEADRRRIRHRIADLTKEIEEVRQHRQVQRQARRKLPFPSAALVGYTSAGKSTLLNTLSGSEVLVDRKLFATLDPTTRRVVLPDGWAVLMTDTVGFIQDLPHDLVAAFRATLEEVTESDFLVHVVDVSHPNMEEQIAAVHQVLRELDADDKPTVTVFNKSDLIQDQYVLRQLVADVPNSVYISAKGHDGIPQLMKTLIKTIQDLLVHVSLEIPYERSDLLSLCYDSGRVISVEYMPERIFVEAQVARDVAGKLEKYKRPTDP